MSKSKSKFGNSHLFVFQHRDLLWLWSVDNDTLTKHKNKVLPAVKEDKWCGINKITKGFTDYDSDDFEMMVYNGCIEHTFGMKGDITKKNERVHWLYISNGDNGKFLELEELEDKGLQISYLSKSFTDDELPNIDTIIRWKNLSEDSSLSKEESEKVYGVFRTLLLSEVNVHTMRNSGGSILQHRLGKKLIDDERDVYLFNEHFNNAQQHIIQMCGKKFQTQLKDMGADVLVEGMDKLITMVRGLSEKVYDNESIDKHIKYSFYIGFDRDKRIQMRGNRKCMNLLHQISNNPKGNFDKLSKLVKVLDTLC